MRIYKYLHSGGTGIILALAAVVLFAAPYGCSKEQKAPGQGAEKAPSAAESASQAPGAKDEARLHFDKGIEFSLRGDYDGAIKEYEAAIAINPNIPEAHNNLGFAYMDKGELEKAEQHQKKALELKPDLANGYFGLAMLYEKMGKGKEALANWKEFAKLSQPHSKWWMTAQEHIQALEGKKPAAPKK